MCNAFQWNCFNLVYKCNIALILFFKCDGAGHVARMEEGRSAFKILAGKPTGETFGEA